MVQLSVEVLVAIGFAAAGFFVWMSKVAWDVGRIAKSIEIRLDQHDKTLGKHAVRIGTLETQK